MSPPRERLDLAKKRVLSILSVRLFANMRQLESKISESGPMRTEISQGQRCDPHVLTEALRELEEEGEIEKDGKFFFLVSHTKTPLKRARLAQRKALIEAHFQKYLALTSNNNEACGDVLEEVLETAIRNSPNYLEIGSRKSQQQSFGDIDLPGPVDSLCILKTRQTTVIAAFEAKNVREWLYADCHEIWSLINKANRLAKKATKPLPILVCRKIPFYSRKAFKALGVLGFETHRQIFHPDYAKEIEPLRDKDLLGFHDITTEMTPSDALQKFVDETVQVNALAYSERFASNHALFSEVAPILAKPKLGRETRRDLWTKVKKELNIYDYMAEHE